MKASSFDEADFSVRRQQTRGSSIGIKTNVAVAIPVIVRQGNLTTGAKISNVSFVPPSQSGNNMPALKMDVSRTGTGGVLGTLIAFSDGGGTPREIGRISNLNVFSEVETRTAVMSLKEVPAGNIRIQYINDFGDKGVLDELVLQKDRKIMEARARMCCGPAALSLPCAGYYGSNAFKLWRYRYYILQQRCPHYG